MLEPEDLSNGPMPGVPVKFGGQFDCSLLNYGVGSPGSSEERIGREGSTGTLSPPENSNERHRMPGMDSPQMSDQSYSASPQDLSTKRPLSDEDGKSKNALFSQFNQVKINIIINKMKEKA